MLAAGSLFTIGFVLARMRHLEAHKWLQTGGVILTTTMVVWMMVLPFRDFALPGIPQELNDRFYSVTLLHAVVGAIALLFGLYVALRGHGLVPNAIKFDNYGRYMRLAYTLYISTILIGVWVYFTWFVNNPNPPVFE